MSFPQRLSKAVLDKHFGKYSETLKKVYATIPFSDLVIQMPQFSKFVKGILDHNPNDKELEKCGLKKLKPSPISLQMADRSVRLPNGVVEDVLVGIGELVFPVDVFVVDMKEDHIIPLIFGLPFLATSQALINVPKGQVTIRA
ncbi:uncharacterized protein LOC110697545 [Chenopodium quinoa]|uniref:uncharacterized protein LOC110697545 n=1 Tax=Chenopodium quinoa TaxID=63459 RepID=UPI000B785447|nr:uncharacterized protein LOC110697545 [Chenopodium quinoa]